MTGATSDEVATFLEQVAQLGPEPRFAELDEPGVAAYLAQLRSVPAKPGDSEPVAAVTPAEAGDGRVPVRIYEPADRRSGAVLVYAHGGGWVTGSLDGYDWTCRRLANGIGCAVVSVGYRLAPEHPYPAPLDDCYDVTCWAADNAGELGGDGRVAVAGSSAGGNLAAAVALRARDAGGPELACQALLYPVLDAALDTESYRLFGDGHFLTRAQMAWFWDQYAPEGADRRDPLLSPGRAPSVAGLPPTLVLTAELDPLRDEGERFAARLAEAGVPTITRRWPGQIHGFLTLVDQFSDALPAFDTIAADVTSLLAGAGTELREGTGG